MVPEGSSGVPEGGVGEEFVERDAADPTEDRHPSDQQRGGRGGGGGVGARRERGGEEAGAGRDQQARGEGTEQASPDGHREPVPAGLVSHRSPLPRGGSQPALPRSGPWSPPSPRRPPRPRRDR